jgi:hypothetical protein
VVSRLKKKLFAISEAAILAFSVWSVLFPNFRPSLAQYSWTDTIEIYKDVTYVYTGIRTITNNETFPIDVKVNLTSTSEIHILQYYELSANGTDFIIISEGTIIRSGATYYGLESGQKLCFSVEAKPTDLVVAGETATVGITVELYSALYAHDVAVVTVIPAKTVVGQGFPLTINVTVENQGEYIEAFNVTLYANITSIATQTVTLTSGNSTTITFTWNTTGFAKGNYTIWAYAESVPGETDTADNTLTDGWVAVAMIGDITGKTEHLLDFIPDGKVDMKDVAIVAKYFGQNVPPAPSNCDITGPTLGVPDGKIDMRDIGLVARHFGETDP